MKETKQKVKARYADFVTEHKRGWCIFNLITTLVSLGMGVGTFLILNGYTGDNCTTTDLKLTLWLVIVMHLLNALETMMNICGLEKYICGCKLACCFFTYEVGILVYMQMIYFANPKCSTEVPLLHFTLLANILVFYIFVFGGVCFVFRKFCPPPEYDSETSSSSSKSSGKKK